MRYILLLFVVFLLAACGSGPKPYDRPAEVQSPKVGKPYQQFGTWYYPKESPYYDEVGLASWYGPGFHGNKTASGERFHKGELSAAHPTLPIPSIAQVTNLENDKSVKVRVNDRGPFHKGRIIDVSKEAAKQLGFLAKGVAKVRVQFLPRETAAIYPNTAYSEKLLALGKEDKTKIVVRVRELEDSRPELEAEPEYFSRKVRIEIGAYASKAMAEEAASELVTLALARISEWSNDTDTLYKLHLGEFDNMTQASPLLHKVLAMGYNRAVLVED